MKDRKWSAESKAKLSASMKRLYAERAAGRPPKSLDHTHQAVIYLKSAARSLAGKRFSELSEAEIFALMAYRQLTEKRE